MCVCVRACVRARVRVCVIIDTCFTDSEAAYPLSSVPTAYKLQYGLAWWTRCSGSFRDVPCPRSEAQHPPDGQPSRQLVARRRRGSRSALRRRRQRMRSRRRRRRRRAVAVPDVEVTSVARPARLSAHLAVPTAPTLIRPPSHPRVGRLRSRGRSHRRSRGRSRGQPVRHACVIVVAVVRRCCHQ